MLQKQVLLSKNRYKTKIINVLLSGAKIKRILLLGERRTKRILQKSITTGKTS